MNIIKIPLETETRVFIDCRLENLGWKPNGKDHNVFYVQHRLKRE